MRAPCSDRSATAALLGLWVFALVLIPRWMAEDLAKGGDPWQQGDWLINFGGGPVRRGALGEALLWLSDALGTSPVHVTAVLQIVLIVTVALALLAAFWRAGRPARLALLLIAPLGLIYWGADPTTHGRKEILAYLATLPLILDPGPKRALWLSAGLFASALAGHEATVLFLPVLIVIAIVRGGPLRVLLPWSAVMSLIAAIGLVFSVTNLTVERPDLICQRLIDRGADPFVCTGIIGWMSQSVTDNLNTVDLLLERMTWAHVLASVIVGLMPVVWTLSRGLGNTLVWLILLISLFAIAPLYPVARDWGRWMAMSTMALTLLMLAAAIWRRDAVRFIDIPPPRWVLILAVLLPLGLSTEQFTLRPLPGLIWAESRP